MARPGRAVALGAAVAGLAAALLAIGAAGAPREADEPRAAATRTAAEPEARLQATLARVPGNYRAWSELGLLYVDRARTSADPSYYDKADGAFTKALALRPDDPTALTGSAALAAARHEFADALRLADRAIALNSFDATAHGVRADALVELGRYDDAAEAVQRMLDLRPGVDSFARASYARELRGDLAGARAAMQRAAEVSAVGGGKAFALHHLGDLAWNSGDLAAAAAAYDAALAADATYVPALAGRARVSAARGRTEAALADYREVVQQQPQPGFLVELGELLQATGQADAAREQYAVVRATQRLLGDAGVDVDAELALFEADHGDPAAAVAMAARSYRERPAAIFVQDAYEWALHKAGRSAEALPVARKAVRLGTRIPALWWHLGEVEAAAGDRDAARRAVQRALDLNPAFSPLHAPQAQRLLASLR